MYAKLENGELIYSPKELIIDGHRVINPSDDMFLEAGYKLVVAKIRPGDGKHYKQVYRETRSNIYLEWEDCEQEYWDNISYDEAVNNEIRKKYSQSQEFAILRQKEEKPEEYSVYYNYCEECKAFVKSKKQVEV